MGCLGEQRHRLEVLDLDRVPGDTSTVLHSGHKRQRLPRSNQLLQHLKAANQRLIAHQNPKEGLQNLPPVELANGVK